MPMCATCQKFVPDLAAHNCPQAAGGVAAIDRLRATYNVNGLTAIPSSPLQHDTIANALCVPTNLAVLRPLVGGDVTKMVALLKIVNADTKQRVSHLVQINRYLPANQKILALLPKKSADLDNDLITAIRGLSASEAAQLTTYFGTAPAGNAVVNLRGYVQHPGHEYRHDELRKALRIVAMVGSKKTDALSRNLMGVWMTAFNAHGPMSNTMPDCSMTPVVLREHYEKHCCNLRGNGRGEEPYWWANNLRYSISKADLVAAGIVLNAQDMQRIFPQGDTITSSTGSKHLFDNFANQALADHLFALHGQKYHTHIRAEFKKASKAFVLFHGKIQIAARKALFFFMASYENGLLQLKSAYSPDNLDTHWANNQVDRIWDIKV